MVDVGDMPTPQTQEPEKYPGGPDSLAEPSGYGAIPGGPMGVDLPPHLNPASAEAEDRVPELVEPDDKSQEPDGSDDQVRESEEPETPV